ncbi:EXS_family protein [Hexamita inflata]|uniref:EXS family protein n=1 Tax=Hexamita inflata TaxID=28002 RepID=A0AA86QC27_9EUKA|nr:EXS family protein [Hexamita inflata]
MQFVQQGLTLKQTRNLNIIIKRQVQSDCRKNVTYARQNINALKLYFLNQEQLRKLALLHDESSTETYHSAKWFKEKMDQTTFDDNNQYQNLQNIIVKAYADLFKVSEKKSLAILMENQSSEENDNVKVRTSAICSFFAGVSAVLLISLINLTAYCYNTPSIKFKLTTIQQMAIRIHFIIVTIILGIGINVYLFHKKKINFTFICQIPGDIVNLMHRNVLKIGYIQLTIVICTTILVIIGQIPIPSPPPLIFGQFVLKVSNIMKPTYWLLFPTLSLPLFTFVNVVKNWGKLHLHLLPYNSVQDVHSVETEN